MTALLKPSQMNAGEFIAWAEAQERGRYELIAGEVVAMAPEIADHARAKFDMAIALRDAIKLANLECEAFVASLSVKIDEQTVFEPDALVNCGERVPAESLYAPNPAIVVEVISPSSRRKDTSAKLLDYFRVPGIEHYLVADLERRLIVHHRRGVAETIVTGIVKEGALRMGPPGTEIWVDGVFGDVGF